MRSSSMTRLIIIGALFQQPPQTMAVHDEVADGTEETVHDKVVTDDTKQGIHDEDDTDDTKQGIHDEDDTDDTKQGIHDEDDTDDTKQGIHDEDATDDSTTGAALNQKCYKFVQDPECPPGAQKEKGITGKTYCQCSDNKKFIDKPKESGGGGQSGGLKGHAKNLLEDAKNLCFEKGDWFYLESEFSDKLVANCICDGSEGRQACAATTQVDLHTTGKAAQASLVCDAKQRVCKIPKGQRCNVKHGFKGQTNDCVDGSTCGAVSQRCVDSLHWIQEKNQITSLSNAVYGDYQNLAKIAGEIAAAAV